MENLFDVRVKIVAKLNHSPDYPGSWQEKGALKLEDGNNIKLNG